jgi:hypothetical protein
VHFTALQRSPAACGDDSPVLPPSPPLGCHCCRLQHAQDSCPAAPTCEEGRAGQVSRMPDTTPRATRRAELLQGQVGMLLHAWMG